MGLSSIIYLAIRTFAGVIADIFFKDIIIVGQENIPKSGPVIICGTHANQFLDAMLMNIGVPRYLGFIIAAKSYRRPVIGAFAKGMKSIPVERPQDLVKSGTGVISQITEDTIRGTNTRFTSEVKPGDVLKIKDFAAEINIKQVNSDTELTYSSDYISEKSGVQLTYKIIPKIDQSKMYEAVWDRLKSGGAVGIFPEGGSHDRTEMLPLKAGVCIMALGSMLDADAVPVKIVPCGLNYYRADRFRSKVVVEFGVPYEVSRSLVEKYKKSKREAIATLLSEIEKRMLAVRISAPTYSELTALFLTRKLYTPAKANLTPEEEYLLNHILTQGYNQMKEEPKVKDFLVKVNQYNKDLRRLRLDDSTVKRISSHEWKNVQIFFYSLIQFILAGVFALPGLLLNGPLGLFIMYLSEKERKKALAGSSVKIKGTDVVASYKVMCALIVIPSAFLLYTIIFGFSVYYFAGIKGTTLTLMTLNFLFFWPLYSYLMILASDGALKHYKNLKARFVLIIFKSKVKELQEMRKELVTRVTSFVEKKGPELLDKMSEKTTFDVVEEELDDDLGAEPQLGRKNTLQAEEALDQAFSLLEEIGI